MQVLLNIHLAAHPGWDGRCEALPARFNLFHDHDERFARSQASTWGKGRVINPEALLRAGFDGGAPSHFAGDKVADIGREVTKDDREVFLGWHWISKPR